MPAIYLQARRNWGAVGLQPSQTFAKFDLLTVDNDSEKKKQKKKTNQFKFPKNYRKHYSCPIHLMHKTNFY